MLFVESTPFRRLTYYLTSPEFLSKYDDNSFSEEDNKRYLRSVASLRNHLRVLQRESYLDSELVERAVSIIEDIHTVLPKLMESTGAPNAGEYLNSLEQQVQALGGVTRAVSEQSSSGAYEKGSFTMPPPSWGTFAAGLQDTASAEHTDSSRQEGGNVEDVSTRQHEVPQAQRAASEETDGPCPLQEHTPAAIETILDADVMAVCEKLFTESAVRHAKAAAMWSYISLALAVGMCGIYAYFAFAPQAGSMAATGGIPFPAAYANGLLGKIFFFFSPIAPLLACMGRARAERRMQYAEQRRLESLVMFQYLGHALDRRGRERLLGEVIAPGPVNR